MSPAHEAARSDGGKRYFEDIAVGEVMLGAPVVVEREAMLAFAREYDSQPMHTDPAAAWAMGLKDVIACGSLTFALSAKSIGSIWSGMHFLPSGLGFQMSFVTPVFAGDRLQVRVEVKGKRPSRDPNRGVLQVATAFLNQDGASVLDVENIWLVRTRNAG